MRIVGGDVEANRVVVMQKGKEKRARREHTLKKLGRGRSRVQKTGGRNRKVFNRTKREL